MKNTIIRITSILFLGAAVMAHAQGTAFTYQGQIQTNGLPANGDYDLTFTLFDSLSGGNQQGNIITNLGTAVTNGLFTVTVDFGNEFPGSNRWLQIGVRTNGGGTFSTLSPRQPLTSTPYAIQSANAASAALAATASSVAAGNITGMLSTAQLPASVVTNGAGGVSVSGTFSGNGAGVTNVNVGTLQQNLAVVTAWGNGASGATNIPAGLGNTVAIAAGSAFSLALKSDGTVVGWGYNGSGQTSIPASLSNVVAISAGESFSLALKSNGTIVGWGDDTFGETTIPAGLSNVVAIAAGEVFSLALKSNGTVVGWVYNGSGQTSIPAGLSNVVAISAGESFSLALKSDGTIVGWGDDTFGETNIPAGLTNVVVIAGGANDFSLALSRQIIPAQVALLTQDDIFQSTITAAGFSGSGGGLTDLNASQLARGTVPFAVLPSNLVTNGENGVTLSGTFGGNGSGLTGVALLASGNTFSGNQTVTNGALYTWGGAVERPANPGWAAAEEFDDITGSAFRAFCGMDGVGLTGTSNQMYVGTYTTHPLGFYTADAERMTITAAGNVGIGITTPTNALDVNGNIDARGNVYANGVLLSSDLNAKENFNRVDSQTVLAKVAALPVTEWNYKTDGKGVQHIGPMAQDFQAAFGLGGGDDKRISVVDEGGVALAAIQGLNRKLEEQVKEKDGKIQDLEQRLERLEKLVSKPESEHEH